MTESITNGIVNNTINNTNPHCNIAVASKGTLHLMPVPLHMEGAVSFMQTHGAAALAVLHSAQYFVVENSRTARRMLATLGLNKAISELNITEIPRTPTTQDWQTLISPALAGQDLLLMSEAGAPAVADPGALLVRAAYTAGITVIAHVGPSSLLLALMASGMNGQSFAFVGYVPQDPGARKLRLAELEARSKAESQTQIIIETPYRNVALVEAVLNNCKPSTLLGIALDLTLPNAYTNTKTVAAWRGKLPDLAKRQMVLTLLG
jgi:16S rRNA (cytidine1402-2'-O)-methyltransferase